MGFVKTPKELDRYYQLKERKYFGSRMLGVMIEVRPEISARLIPPPLEPAETSGGMGLDPQTTGMVWEEIARWGPGFAATLIPGAVVPQFISFLAPENRELVDKFVIPYCEDNTGRYLTAWCRSEPEVGSDGSNYKDLNVRHHTVAEQSANGYMLSGTNETLLIKAAALL